jgi:hypothetical protein
MAEPARNFEQPHDRDARLHALGLDQLTVEEIALYGLRARQGVSPLAPPSFPGTTQWAETIVGARLILVPKDWTLDDSHNFSLVISPDGRIAIAVATGDENTGIATAEPRTKHTKGAETEAAVQANAQLEIPGLSLVTQDTPQRETWVFLICTTAHEMRFELSRPKKQDRDGRVTKWSDRILFPPIDLESLPARDDDGDDDDGDDGGIDVPVERI